MIDKNQIRKLSKALSHALRHHPEQYHITLDAQGWTPLAAMIAGLHRRRPDLGPITKADIDLVLAQPGKRRYEIADGNIRALYGHSVPLLIEMETAEPPAILYHGTAPQTAQIILQEGLQPMTRQRVHLSVDVATAVQVGRRKSKTPAILAVDAARAHADGIAFYPSQDEVWQSDPVPATYITTLESADD